MHLKFYFFLVLLIPWLKGGNARDLVFYIALSCIVICLIVSLANEIKESKLNILRTSPIYVLIILVISIANPILDAEKINTDIVVLDETEENVLLKSIFDDLELIDNEELYNYIILNIKNEISYKSKIISAKLSDKLEYLNFLKSKIYNPYIPSVSHINISLLTEIIIIFVAMLAPIILIANVRSDKVYRLISLFILINGFLLSQLGIAQKFGILDFGKYPILGIWEVNDPRYYFSTFSYKNHWSAFCLLCVFHGIAFVGGKLQSKRSYNIKTLILCSTMVIISILTLFIIDSRSALLMLLIYIFLLVFIYSRGFLNYIYITLTILILSVFSVGLFKTSDVVKRSIGQFNDLENGKFSFRMLLWKDITGQIESKTFWGYGINSYKTVNPIFQSTETVSSRYVVTENAHREFTPIIQNAHSDLFQYTSEMGFVFLCLILFPMFFIILREFLFSKNYYFRLISAGCLVYIGYSCVDLPNKSFANLLLFSLTFGFLLGYRKLSLNRSSVVN